MKRCSVCQKEKELTEFHKSKSKTMGVQSYCISCRYEKWPAKVTNEMNRNRRRAFKEKEMFKSAKTRAKKNNIEFSIALSDIVIPKECPYLHIPLSFGTGSVGPNSPTLDRIDPTLGYVPGNVTVCSFRANAIKRDATPEELKSMYLAVKDMVRKSN